MKQIFIFHGGDSFGSYEEYIKYLKTTTLEYERMRPEIRWKEQTVDVFRGDADVLMPTMPNSANAQFDEWSIWFEKIIPFMKDDVRLIGHSLGAMFLAKYLHEHPLDKPVKQLILLAGGYDSDTEGYGSFKIKSATGVEKSAREIHLFHSQDDHVVPFAELAKFRADLPDAVVHTFTDRNHFLDADFPELIELLEQK